MDCPRQKTPVTKLMANQWLFIAFLTTLWLPSIRLNYEMFQWWNKTNFPFPDQTLKNQQKKSQSGRGRGASKEYQAESWSGKEKRSGEYNEDFKRGSRG